MALLKKTLYLVFSYITTTTTTDLSRMNYLRLILRWGNRFDWHLLTATRKWTDVSQVPLLQRRFVPGLLCVCVCVCDHRTTCGRKFSPSTTWGPWIERRLLGSAVGALTLSHHLTGSQTCALTTYSGTFVPSLQLGTEDKHYATALRKIQDNR